MSKKPPGQRPTHRLTIKATDGKRYEVGVAWVDARGWFTVKLNPHVVLSEVQLRDAYLNLYPSTFKEPEQPADTTGAEVGQ